MQLFEKHMYRVLTIINMQASIASLLIDFGLIYLGQKNLLNGATQKLRKVLGAFPHASRRLQQLRQDRRYSSTC
jgi:hypothetical protein